VGGSEAKKGPGSDFLCVISFMVFLSSSHREAPKSVIKEIEKIGFGFFVGFRKTFSTRFFCKTFFVVFLDSHRGEAPENAITHKKLRKN
jgi:hypothetical protein